MLCAQCGNPIAAGNTFCVQCGRTIVPADSAPQQTQWQSVFAAPKTDNKAIASLVFGCLFFLFPASVLAIILGHLSLADIRKSAGRMQGRGLAITGLILGYVGVSAIPIAFLIGLAVILPDLRNARAPTPAPSVITSIRALNASEIGFARAHPEIGFTCNLDDLVGSGGIYGWKDPVLASGKKNGYSFEVRNCAPAHGSGANAKYQIVGSPLRNEAKMWVFCSDESAVIRYDTASVEKCFAHGPVW